jgi:hypothetical protein
MTPDIILSHSPQPMTRIRTLATLAAIALSAACAEPSTAPVAPVAARPSLAVLSASAIPDTVNPFVTIWEDGFDSTTGLGYEIIEYPACGDTTGAPKGSVVLLWRSLSPTVIETTVYKAKAAPGWSYSVQTPSTTSGKVEVNFTTPGFECLFRASYQPGKTVIDGGRIDKASGGGGSGGGRRPRGTGGA